MARRLELQAILEAIPGVTKVYFQPPESVKLSYPCIVYNKDPAWTDSADNVTYRRFPRYQVTVIDRNPDSLIPDRVAELTFARETSCFATSGLNHNVFSIYF